MIRNNSKSLSGRRTTTVVGVVLLLHVAGLWALQTGLLQRAVELVVPVEVIASMVEAPKPLQEPPKPVAAKPAVVRHTEVLQTPPTPVPVAIPDTVPTPNSAIGTTVAQPALSPIGTPAGPPKSAPAVAIAPKVELPSSSAEYLHNPKPVYPNISKRRGEQGMVLLSVLIGPDGTAQEAKVKTSSGFERLDQTALDTVKSWRYVPGKRAGVPEAMWFNVPINFVLE
jgi:protein TonB